MIESRKPSILFWILGVIFLLWNIFNCLIYLLDKSFTDAGHIKFGGEALFAMRNQIPLWAKTGYAAGVFSGILAAILFLLRKKLAYPMFVLSLLGAIISFIWMFITPEYKAAGGSQYEVMPVIVFAIGAVEIWVSNRKIATGILT